MTSDPAKAKHVLIVEDEPDFAALLWSILTKGGYTASTAHNWEEALKELENKTPDLITLDVNIPEKSGMFFYRDIKANQRFRDVPVIVVTGLTRDDEDMEHVVRSLMELDHVPPPKAYVEKPVDGPSLLRTVQEALSSSESENR